MKRSLLFRPAASAVLSYWIRLLHDLGEINAMSVRKLARCEVKLSLGKSTSFDTRKRPIMLNQA